MDNKNYTTLLNVLAKNGVCKTGKRYLSGTDKDFDTLVKVMKGWPEYLYEHSEIAISLFRKYIDDTGIKELAKKGIFFDFKGTQSIRNDLSPIFVIGSSQMQLDVLDNEVVKIYIFNDCEVEVLGKESTFVDLEAWNNSSIKMSSGSGIAYCYDNATIKSDTRIECKKYNRGDVFNGKEMQKGIK